MVTKKTETKKVTKGKKKGFKKDNLVIKEPSLSPYYLIRENKQFIKMLEGSTLPQGYYTKLGSAIDSIAKDLVLDRNIGDTLTLRKYITEYENISNEILETVQV